MDSRWANINPRPKTQGAEQRCKFWLIGHRLRFLVRESHEIGGDDNVEGGNTRASLGSTVSVQVGLALQPQHLPCEGTCASLVPCSHPVQAPVFPTRNSCLLCPFDTRACATTLMLFFSAKDFPADKMVLGSGKRLLGFVPSHRDSLVSALLLFLP